MISGGDFNPDVASWKQLADRLRRAIRSGELAPGQRFPTEETLGQEYSLSRVTVRRALRQLRSEGLITVVRSRGTFVADQHERQPVTLRAGDTVETRMPDPDERHRHGLREGEPLVIVTRADKTTEYYGGYRVKIRGS